MFVSRSKYRDLEARHQHAVEQLGKAREQLADWKGSSIRTAGRNDELQRRLEVAREAVGDDAEYAGQLESRLARLVRACARYRAELAAETRQVGHLQARLDDALGLNTAGIKLGRGWQDRREDKRVRGSS